MIASRKDRKPENDNYRELALYITDTKNEGKKVLMRWSAGCSFVNVKFLSDGVTHWVLIVGAEEGEFIIYDPANRLKSYLPLFCHGRVYAYRVLEKSR